MNEIALIGKKIGMTREFYKTGQLVPVTVLKMEKARVIQVIEEDKRGYKAVQLGYGKIKNSKLTKAMKGYFAKKNTEAKKLLKEFRVENTETYKEGNEFGLEIFKDIKFVDTRSKTIGKGFAGAMKRHNFGGLRATHGVSVSHRSHGSTGQRQDPGKVFKGKKMAGHMGDKLRTMQNIEIIKTDLENELLYLKGSIPGAKNTEVLVKKSVKNINKLTVQKIMKLDKLHLDGKKDSIEVLDKIFSAKINKKLVSSVLYKTNANYKGRHAKTKQQNEVSGPTSKIYAQKGTGGARHASRKAPIFVGGGIAHGPKGELSYKKRKLNKSEKKLSVASLITEKNKNKNLLVFSDFNNEIKKTKEMHSIIKKFEITNSLIILDKNSKDKIEKSVRNIPNVKVTDVNHFSSFDIIKFKKVVFTESSIKELEKRYS